MFICSAKWLIFQGFFLVDYYSIFSMGLCLNTQWFEREDSILFLTQSIRDTAWYPEHQQNIEKWHFNFTHNPVTHECSTYSHGMKKWEKKAYLNQWPNLKCSNTSAENTNKTRTMCLLINFNLETGSCYVNHGGLRIIEIHLLLQGTGINAIYTLWHLDRITLLARFCVCLWMHVYMCGTWVGTCYSTFVDVKAQL